jgi:hypothetical protein
VICESDVVPDLVIPPPPPPPLVADTILPVLSIVTSDKLGYSPGTTPVGFKDIDPLLVMVMLVALPMLVLIKSAGSN